MHGGGMSGVDTSAWIAAVLKILAFTN